MLLPEHEASTQSSVKQIFIFSPEVFRKKKAIHMIVNGFCKEVIKELPLEFAQEAQKTSP